MRVRLYRKKLIWRVGLYGKNGEQVMVSEAYFSKNNAKRAARRISDELGAKQWQV